jgi:hypothetical protein
MDGILRAEVRAAMSLGQSRFAIDHWQPRHTTAISYLQLVAMAGERAA